MNAPSKAPTRTLWILVFLLGASASTWVFHWLQSEQHRMLKEEAVHRSQVKLALIKQVIEHQFNLTADALSYLEQAPTTDHEGLQHVADNLLKMHAGQIAHIAFLGKSGDRPGILASSGTPSWSVPVPGLPALPPAKRTLSLIRDAEGTWLLRFMQGSTKDKLCWVVVDLPAPQLLESGVSSTVPAGLDVDVHVFAREHWIHLLHHASRTRTAGVADSDPPMWQGGFEVAGKRFLVRTRAAPTLIERYLTPYPYLALLGGLVISTLLAVSVYQRTRYMDGLQHMVDEKTQSLRLYQRIYDASIDAIAILDPEARYMEQNPAHAQLLGYTDEQLRGQSLLLQLNDQDRRRVRKALEGQGMFRGIIECLSWHGHRLDIDMSLFPLGKPEQPSCYIAIKRDVSERKRVEAQLKWLSYYDELTSLPNRRLFGDRLEQAIRLAKRDGHRLALLYLDLDRFKYINDSLGHGVGDRVLQEVARRMCMVLRESDTAARMGGDEFTVLLPEADAQSAIQVSERLAEIIRQPIQIDAQMLSTDTSIGISVYPDNGEDAESLLRHADTAMYYAKRRGETYYLFSDAMAAQSERRLKLEQSLNKACSSREFTLVYQTRHDLGIPGAVHDIPLDQWPVLGVEALIRWEHAELGLVPPSQFIPLAEETGHIRAITEWVLTTACQQALTWEREGIRPRSIGINLSAIQLAQQGLALDLLQVIEDHGAEPHWFEIEITETAIMHDPEMAGQLMKRLADSGMTIAIDDFGTGYSSLAYLKRFPADWIKIDRSFVEGISNNEEDRAIIRAITAMAHSLGMKVVAEGVETLDQLQALRSEGCDAAQGYLFTRPFPASEAPTFLIHASRPAGQT